MVVCHDDFSRVWGSVLLSESKHGNGACVDF